jgi:hypothetical protein
MLIIGSDLNHNQTLVRPATQSAPLPGLAFNHNQTLVRR